MENFISNQRAQFVNKIYGLLGGRVAAMQIAAAKTLSRADKFAAYEAFVTAIRAVYAIELVDAEATFRRLQNEANESWKGFQALPINKGKRLSDEDRRRCYATADEAHDSWKNAQERPKRFEAELQVLVDAEPAIIAEIEERAAKRAAKAEAEAKGTGTEG